MNSPSGNTGVPRRPPALMFGVPIANVTMDETLALIGSFIENGRRRRRTHQIATVNVDFLVNGFDDPAIASILQEADACLADGTPIVWWAKLLDMPLPERVAGSDLVPLLFDTSQSMGWRVHVFGSSAEVASRAEALIAERYPRANVSIDPGPIIDDVTDLGDDVLGSIAAIDADVLCVALGNPKQERFIRAHRQRLAVPVMIGVGGSLDMFVGHRKRAPVWVQRIGLEWVARAVQEPRRLGRRYAHDVRTILPRCLREWRTHRRRRDAAGLALEIAADTVEVRIGDNLVVTDAVWAEAATSVQRGSALEIRSTSTTSISDRAAAQLIGLVRLARTFESPVVWTEPPDRLRQGLEQMGVVPAMLACDERWLPERSA